MAETRKGEVTMKGNPVELVGPKLKAGDPAPGFTCAGAGLALVTQEQTKGKVALFSVVPSLDTPVCSTQTKKFADQLGSLGDSVAAYTVSLDLPFAQARFCTDNKIANIQNLSDAHDHSFGRNFGVLIQGLAVPLLARAIFVVDPAGTIRHAEIVPEIASEPNYDAAMAALKTAAGA